MATRRVTTTTAARQAQLRAQQELAMRRAMLGQGIVSPYDGTTPTGGFPLEAGARPASLAGLDAGRPQVNATNQSALAPNGDINQNVTNENKYENKYYNIITSPSYGYGGGYYNPYASGTGWGGWGSGWPSQCVIDPFTGVMYARNEGGFVGWLKRLFRGY